MGFRKTKIGKSRMVSCGFMRNIKALVVIMTLFGMSAQVLAQPSGLENGSNFFLDSQFHQVRRDNGGTLSG